MSEATLAEKQLVVRSLIERHRPGYGLERVFYHDPAVYERDLERIWMRHWLVAGHASQAPNPGDFFTIRFDSESVIIVRGKDGALRALLNVCAGIAARKSARRLRARLRISSALTTPGPMDWTARSRRRAICLRALTGPAMR